jgi:hypothetical protein
MVVTGELRYPYRAGRLFQESHLNGSLRAVDFMFPHPGQLSQQLRLIHLLKFQKIIPFHRCCFLDHDFQIRLKSKKVRHAGSPNAIVVEPLSRHAGRREGGGKGGPRKIVFQRIHSSRCEESAIPPFVKGSLPEKTYGQP